jgi:hypothetical protein
MSTPLVGFGSTMVGSDVALRRKILRKAFKSNKITVNGTTVRSMAGPFKASLSQADPLNRLYQSCGGCNQVHDVNIHIRLNQDGISNNYCDVDTNGFTPKQIPLESGNSKYVNDSSLFTRFKNLSSLNQNYNDITFGGNAHNGSYVSLMSVRRR